MTDLTWTHEDSPTWDADKQRVIGSAPEGAFDHSYTDGDALPGDWWSARTSDGAVAGYGWLDATWGGDAEILLAVDAASQRQGVGSFVIDRLEHEAASRGSTTSTTRSARRIPTATTCTTGWRCAATAAPRAVRTTPRSASGSAPTSGRRRCATVRRRPSPPLRIPTTRPAPAIGRRATRSPAATSTWTTTGTDRTVAPARTSEHGFRGGVRSSVTGGGGQ